LTELYDPKAFFTHAALLRQGFPHCAKFLTAASRRTATSMERSPFIPKTGVPGTVSGISHAFAKLSQIQGQVTHALLTRAPLYSFLQAGSFSFDLHVLGTPPAFILSQDQTLRLNHRLVEPVFRLRPVTAASLFSFQRASIFSILSPPLIRVKDFVALLKMETRLYRQTLFLSSINSKKFSIFQKYAH